MCVCDRERERKREVRTPFPCEECEGGQWQQRNQQQPQRESPVSPLAGVDNPLTKLALPAPFTTLDRQLIINEEGEIEIEKTEWGWEALGLFGVAADAQLKERKFATGGPPLGPTLLLTDTFQFSFVRTY